LIPSRPSPGQLLVGVSTTSRVFSVFVLYTVSMMGRFTEF
jgi:hypothetical protein